MITQNGMTMIDKETGEVWTVPAQTEVVTAYDKQIRKEAKELKERCAERRKTLFKNMDNKGGEFFWSLYNVNETYHPNLSDDMLVKVIYLLSYMRYDNRLMMRDRADDPFRPMTKSDVRDIIRIHKKKFPYFWKRLMESGIILETAEGELIVSSDFSRGKLEKKNMEDMVAIKLFSRAIRHMYEKTEVRTHKYLAYLYRLIPYINLKYNVVCYNPLETNIAKIQKISTRDLCAIFGLEESKRTAERLVDALFQLRFIDKNKDEVSVITLMKRIVNNKVDWYITINPQFLSGYIGLDDYNELVNEFYIDGRSDAIETS